MDIGQKIYKIFQYVRENGTYIERPYQTIGGMWTVDRWRHEALGITVELMDEGATQGVVGENVKAYDTYGQKPQFVFGNEAGLDEIIAKI